MSTKPSCEEMEHRIKELGHAREAFISSEEKFRLFIESLGEGVCALDTEFRIFFLNNRMAEMLGYVPEEMLGKSVKSFMHEGDLGDHRSRMARLRQGLVDNYERRFRHRNGHEVYTQVSATATKNENGDVVGFWALIVDISDRKRTEEALRFTQYAIDKTIDQAFWTIEDGSLFYVNDAACRSLGYSRDELLKLSIPEIDPTCPPELFAKYWQDVKIKGFAEFESFHCAKDGRVYPVNIRSSYVVFDGMEYNCAFATDVSERKRAEEALRASESRFKGFAEQSLVGLYVIQEGRYRYVNPRFAEIYGYTVKELLGGLPEDKLVYPEDLPLVEENVRKRLSGEASSAIFTFRGLKKNGEVFFVEVYGSRIIYNNKPALMGTVIDISERKIAEEKLKTSERTYREIFNASHDVIFVHDVDSGVIVDVNLKAKDLYGYEPFELIGKTVEIVSADEEPFTLSKASDWIRKAVEEGPQIFEWKARDRKGETFWVGVSLKRASIGGEDRLLAVVSDIRQRKVAELELEKYRKHLEEVVDQRTAEIKAKNSELETFTYSVSHDLKAPLRGIDGYSRLLLEEYSDRLDDEGQTFLENVRKSTEQMNQLIEDLLVYSRMERREIHTARVELAPLVELLIFERQHDIESGRIKIQRNIPFDSMAVDGDTVRQVIGNYLDNAIKFSKSQDQEPLVEISGHESDTAWRLWVKDNGIGFDPQYHDRIFQIFHRLHRIEDYPGTGVGLAIVRKAVERIGGRVWAESELGKGAIFFVEIPKKNKQGKRQRGHAE